MNYIIHRGYHLKKNEENKIPAFLKTLNSREYLGIETDIRETLDNTFVLYHDPLFKGKLVKQTKYQEMQKENIPKLTDLLKINTDKILLLEIKDFNINIKKLIKTLDKYPRNIYLMSFSNKVIENISKLNSKYKLGILNYVFNTTNNYNYDFICIINDILTENIIKKYNSLNIQVFSYGIHKKEAIKYQEVTYIVENKVLNT